MNSEEKAGILFPILHFIVRSCTAEALPPSHHLLPQCLPAVILTHLFGGQVCAPSRQASISSYLCCDTWRVIVINCTHLGGRSGQLMRRCCGQNVITPIQTTGGQKGMIPAITKRFFWVFFFHFSSISQGNWGTKPGQLSSSLFPISPSFSDCPDCLHLQQISETGMTDLLVNSL